MGVGTVIVVIIGLSYLERLQMIWNATDVVKKYKSINYFKTKKNRSTNRPSALFQIPKKKKRKIHSVTFKNNANIFSTFYSQFNLCVVFQMV